MDIKNNIEQALLLHKKKDIHKMDVLSGDEDIANVLNDARDDVETLVELKHYFSHEISELLPPAEIHEKIADDFIDESINKIIDKIDNEFVKNELYRLNNSKKKKIRSRMMSNILSSKNYFYLGFIELLHLASLIQDDVIDEASTRRFIETSNSRYDDRIAILTSDILLLELMYQLNQFYKTDKKIDERYYNEHYNLFLQMIASEKNMNVNSLTSYYEYIQGKTSNLFAVSIANSYAIEYEDTFAEPEFEKFFKFGVDFGNVFQIIDDYKDYYSNEMATGKTKTDFKNNSPNYFNFVKGDTDSHKEMITRMITKLKKQEKANLFYEQIDMLEKTINNI